MRSHTLFGAVGFLEDFLRLPLEECQPVKKTNSRETRVLPLCGLPERLKLCLAEVQRISEDQLRCGTSGNALDWLWWRLPRD